MPGNSLADSCSCTLLTALLLCLAPYGFAQDVIERVGERFRHPVQGAPTNALCVCALYLAGGPDRLRSEQASEVDRAWCITGSVS